MDNLKGLRDFIDHSPTSFHAIQNAENMLLEAGYSRLTLNGDYQLKPGAKVYFKRNDQSLVALNIGAESFRYGNPFHIVASHVDSPCFKVKPHIESENSNYHKVDVEPYGGMIMPSWMDRILSIAGRVVYKDNDQIRSELVNLDKDLLMMPNLCIHFNRDINDGYKYNPACDTQPIASEPGFGIIGEIAAGLQIPPENILSHDLYVYNRDKSKVWGLDEDYISAPRIDDLECVYFSTLAYTRNTNSHAINVLYLANNEEVGSLSATGADSDHLYTILKTIAENMHFSLESALAKSFLVSADNAHAVHPNHPEVSDPVDAPHLNGGIVIKYNASNRYTSDGLSAGLFIEMLKKHDISYQTFTNRSDIRGGSTLGNILLSHVSVLAVDIGFAQLAMHSAYETAGTVDALNGEDVFKAFFTTDFRKNGDTYIVE